MGNVKNPSSTTETTYPPWLMEALQPLIGGATQNMGQFMNQGFNVLQGRSPNAGLNNRGGPRRNQGGSGGGSSGPSIRELLESEGGRRGPRYGRRRR